MFIEPKRTQGLMLTEIRDADNCRLRVGEMERQAGRALTDELRAYYLTLARHWREAGQELEQAQPPPLSCDEHEA